MTQEEFDRCLMEKKAKEQAIASSFASADDEQILPLLYAYISCKYLLEPDEMDTENLLQLGERSTAKIAGLQKSGLEFREKSAGCTTASSGVIKKVLLSMAIGKLIGVSLAPEAVAKAETVAQLADLIVQVRGGVK